MKFNSVSLLILVVTVSVFSGNIQDKSKQKPENAVATYETQLSKISNHEFYISN